MSDPTSSLPPGYVEPPSQLEGDKKPLVPKLPVGYTEPPSSLEGDQKTDWQNLPAIIPNNDGQGSVLTRALGNAPADLADIGSGIYHTFRHPIESLQGATNLARGATEKVTGYAPQTWGDPLSTGYLQANPTTGETNPAPYTAQANPEEAQNRSDLVDALINHYGSYTSIAGWKQNIAEHPFGTAMDVASVLSPGLRAASGAAPAGAIANTLASASKVAGRIDPIQSAIDLAKVTSPYIKKATNVIQSGLTNAPESAFNVAQSAGRTTDPVAKKIFNDFKSGNGDYNSMASSASDAVDELAKESSDNYVEQLRQFGQRPEQLPFSKIDNSLTAFNDAMTGFGVSAGYANARDSYNNVFNIVSDYRQSNNPAARTMVGLDDMKKNVQNLINNTNDSVAKQHLNGVASAIRETINDADPKYGELMDQWSDWRDELNNYKKTLGLGNNTATNSTISKIMRANVKETGQPLIEALSNTKSGQYLPHMLAGSALSPLTASGSQRMAEILGPMATWAMSPSAWHALPLVAGQVAAQSPRLQGNLSYGLGAAQRLAAPAVNNPVVQGAVMPAMRAAAPVTSALISQPGRTAAYRLHDATDQYPSDEKLEQYTVTPGSQGTSVARATGGRVGDHHERLVSRLMTLAERAKKDVNSTTEPLLNVPDATIVKALHVANQAI